MALYALKASVNGDRVDVSSKEKRQIIFCGCSKYVELDAFVNSIEALIRAKFVQIFVSSPDWLRKRLRRY